MRKGITPAEALQIVLDHTPLLGAETTSVAEARGRVLAEAVHSNRQLPPSDNSAMDGFAVRSADLVSASAEHPVVLEVVTEIPAGGSADRALRAGKTVRTLTAAPFPPGRDAAVKQYDHPRPPPRAQVRLSPPPREDVRLTWAAAVPDHPLPHPGALVAPPAPANRQRPDDQARPIPLRTREVGNPGYREVLRQRRGDEVS